MIGARVARSALRLRSASPRFASTLVLAEHTQGALSPATLSAVTAAKQLNQDVHALVFGGADASGAAEQLAKTGVQHVQVIANDALKNKEAERVVPVLHKFLEDNKSEYTHVVAGSTSFAKNYLPRLAAKLDVSPVTDIISISSPDTFVRPIYAGNVLSTVKCHESVKLLTVRTTNFAPVESGSSSCKVTNVDVEVKEGVELSEWVSSAVSASDRPELTVAKVVVSGGRGMKSGENFTMLYELADKLNGAVGASRAAVDAGFVSNELQVGQTGKVVAPDLYIAVGISGAIQHLAGMKDSKCIVAINKDAEAPIFQVADYGLVGDLFEIVPSISKAL